MAKLAGHDRGSQRGEAEAPGRRQDQQDAAIAALAARGAHLVLCRHKRPLWRAWQKRAPNLDAALEHAQLGSPLGIIPWSLGTTALDVDDGDAGVLIQAWPPAADYPTRRDGGRHLFYEDSHGRRNATFKSHGCKGEIRGARGFLILWGRAPEILAEALEHPRPGAMRFPADLFEPMPRVFRPEAAAAVQSGPTATDLELEAVSRGRRNTALFDVTRYAAYTWSKPEAVADWRARVEAFALEQNERFREPLGRREVAWTAWSIASWVWSGFGPLDHGPAAQRRRGVKSGRVRRAAVVERDVAIVAAAIAGESMRAIAKRHQISERAVRYVVRRDAPLAALGVGGVHHGQRTQSGLFVGGFHYAT